MIKKPLPTGGYAVGTMTYSLYGDRSIACRVYFPVRNEDTEGLSKPRYMSPEICKGLGKTLMIPLSYKKIEKSGENFSECYEKAPFIEGEKFPLIVFSHGSGSYRESNSFMCIDIASHGYAVLCIAHPGMAACVEYDNGTYEYAVKNMTFRTYKPFFKGVRAISRFMKEKGTDKELAVKFDEFQKTYCGFLRENLILWMEDTRRAVAYAEENLSHMIDFEKGIGATGHSFGGITAYALCQNDPKFTCGINIDCLTVGDYDGKILDKPFMLISCEANLCMQTRTFLDHKKPVYSVILKDMEHHGLSDMKFAIPSPKIVGALPPEVMHENLCSCHIEFFDAYLKKIKDRPVLTSNESVTVREFAPDI
ncbi:MAG: hypothetical protein IKT14_03760 [Clostridiales bacterium]|nr:hypothetical protein [Clostridiales bacterium]